MHQSMTSLSSSSANHTCTDKGSAGCALMKTQDWSLQLLRLSSTSWPRTVPISPQCFDTICTPSAQYAHTAKCSSCTHANWLGVICIIWSTLMNVFWLCENLICTWGEVHVEYAHVSTLFLNTFLIRKARKRWIKAWQHPKNLGYK